MNVLTCQQEREKKKESSPVRLDQTGLTPGMIIKLLLACISRNEMSNIQESGLHSTPDANFLLSRRIRSNHFLVGKDQLWLA